MILFSRHLFTLGKFSFYSTKVHISHTGILTLDNPAPDIFFSTRILIENIASFGFPDTLCYSMLGSLSGYPAKIFWCYLYLDDILNFIMRINCLGFFQRNFPLDAFSL